MQTVDTEEAAQLFERLRQVIVENDMFESMSSSDEAFLEKTIGALLITGPVEDGVPFEIDCSSSATVALQRLEGSDFSVHSAKVTPYSNMYRVQFYASSPADQFIYEFKGRVRRGLPPLMVEKAEMYETPSDGEKVDFSLR